MRANRERDAKRLGPYSDPRSVKQGGSFIREFVKGT